MKRFLLDTLVTLALGLLLVVPFDMSTRLGVNDTRLKYDYITSHPNDFKVLLLGNSLFAMSFDVGEIDGGFCMAVSGRSVEMDRLLAERFLPTMDSVDVVLFPMHYNLSWYRWPLTRTQKNDIFVHYMYMRQPYPHFPEGHLYRTAFFSGNFSHRMCIKQDVELGNGYLKQKQIWNGRNADGLSYKQYPSKPYFEALRGIAKVCSERGVRFIVVTPPFSNLYLSKVTEEGVKVLDSVIDAVAESYPIEYKNYMADSEFRDNSLYLDWNHLNNRGATLFARRVKADFGL